MLKVKLQYFGHLMWRTDSFEKTLMLGKIEGRRRRQWQRMKLLDGIADSMEMSLSKIQEMVKDIGKPSVLFIGSQRVRHDWATENQFLLISDVEYFFVDLLSTCMSPLRNIYSDIFPIFKLEWNDLFLFALNCMSLLHILDINPLSDILSDNILSHFLDLLVSSDSFFCYAEYF